MALGLEITLLTADAEDGGSPILQYEVQYDDGARGAYRSVYTLSPEVVVTYGIARGQEYRTRYRAMNFNGWGQYGPVGYIEAAGLPQKPPPPVLLSSDSTQLTLAIIPTADDAGGAISAYELYIDSIQLNPAFSLVSSDASMTRTLTFASYPALTIGNRYRFVVKAVNHVGASSASEELRVALGGLPGPPGAPYKVEASSSTNSLMTAWALSAEIDGIDIEGYSLYMDDGYNGDFRLAYDGSGEPQVFQFLATNLTSGLPYRFALSAHNLNGESTMGAVAIIYACLQPGALAAPRMTSTTKTSIAIAWEEPASNGCPVTGFTILRNSGADDDVTIAVDSGAVENLASLRAYTITGLLSTSSTYRIKVRAHNYAGQTDSAPLVIVLAAVPDTPTDLVTSDATETNQTQITVIYGPLATAGNGGSDVLSYELQMDDGEGGDFVALIGNETQGDSLATRHTVAYSL